MNKNEIYCDSCELYHASELMSVVVYTDSNLGGDYCEECLADAIAMEEVSASWAFATA
jgi:uncharacterized protein CbrC (UPF0167 family)